MSREDDDAYELTRRRLEEEVKSKVETELFRYYRNLGSIIIAVLGAVGIAVGWPALIDRIDQEIRKQITEQISEPVKDARETANEANKIATGISLVLKEKQETLNESIGRLGGKFDDMHVRYGEASAQVETMEEQLKEQRQLTEFFKSRVQTNPVSREEIRQLEERLTQLVEQQTRQLAEAINLIGSGASGQGATVVDPEKLVNELYDKQAVATSAAEEEYSDLRRNATVYVQFAGGKRSDIQSVSTRLKDMGWTVPGEERLGTAAGKNEVRYFRESDKEAADLLAEDVNEAIAAVGFKPKNVTAKKVGVKDIPAVGILELWLEIRIR